MISKTSLFTVCLIVLMSVGLSACETMYGAGKDIENAGESVQDAAE